MRKLQFPSEPKTVSLRYAAKHYYGVNFFTALRLAKRPASCQCPPSRSADRGEVHADC